MDVMLLLIALLGGHALGDYAFQSSFMSKAKDRYTLIPVPGVPWYQVMGAHVTIHGALVSLITGIWWLGVLEAIIHFWTDDRRCAGKFSYNVDQGIHIVCKFMWWFITIKMTTNAF